MWGPAADHTFQQNTSAGANPAGETTEIVEKTMKHVKTMIMMFLAATLAAQLAVAQAAPGAGPNEQEVAAKIEQISQALQLTPQQKQQIAPILKAEIPQLQAIKSNTSMGKLQKLEQLKQISSATDAKIMPILNPEQQQKFQAIREQERQQMMQKLESQ